MSTIAVIPARGGSKGIKMKNIKLFKGKPLIAWSIELAHQCQEIDRVIVSTDHDEIAEIAREFGAEVPFMRPSEISNDLSTDLECMKHCINWLRNVGQDVKTIVQLRPTYPTRTQQHLHNCIELFRNNDCDSVRTVIAIDKSAYKMYRVIDLSLIHI